jgi:hypothetical protein
MGLTKDVKCFPCFPYKSCQRKERRALQEAIAHIGEIRESRLPPSPRHVNVVASSGQPFRPAATTLVLLVGEGVLAMTTALRVPEGGAAAPLWRTTR